MEILLPILLSMPAGAMSAIGVSLFFSAFLAALFYMVAYALQNPQLIALGKEEISAFVFSLVIISFWMTSDALLNSLIAGMLTSSIPSWMISSGASDFSTIHLDLATSALDVLFVKLKDMYINLYLYEILIGFLSTVSFPIGSPVPALSVISLSLSPFTGLVLLSNAHTTVVEAIGYAMMVIWAKKFVLLFCKDAIPTILLPMGVVMRAFPFFRSTGSSIIAICVAGYFVLPFAILLSNYMIFELYQPAEFAYIPEVSTLFSGEGVDQQDIEGEMEYARGNHAEEVHELFTQDPVAEQGVSEVSECAGHPVRRVICGAWNILTATKDVIVEIAQTAWSIATFMVGMTGDFFFSFWTNPLLPPSVSAGLYYFIITEVSTLGQFLILILVSTVVELIITITMYRNISILLGGEAEIAGLTKIV